MVRRSRITLLAAGVALAGLVSACGVQGAAVPGEPDVRTLEVGPYPVDRHSYDQDPHGKGALLEGIRMADAVAPVVSIDPVLNVGVDAGVVATSDQAVDGYLATVAKPVLDKHNMVVAYRAMGADLPFEPFQTEPVEPSPDTVVLQLLMRFPGAAVAAQAARDLEESDFQVAPDQNRRVRHPDYPAAMIHWRPGVANMGTFVAVGEFVLFVFVARPSADEKDLLAWTGNALRVAIPAAQSFQPTPMDKLNTLRVDPDGLLARVAVQDRDRELDTDHFSVHPPATLVHMDSNQASLRRTIEQNGLDQVAVIDNSWVLRVRDPSKAPALAADLIAGAGEEFDPVAAPNDVPGATCQHLNKRGNVDRQYRYQCFVTYKRYVAVVAGDSEADIRQRVAAQYALLANSM
ncbi:DUF7373 family lipoprotein [Nocardia bovistercoris]|uniref:Uncharacterized protein n=1 Tax=Nocardia bovistercoris TaxID=2785916 RepID=A0A931I4N9_9NOCA|nr:hypothetical protein [Nocardia bovistercoris]MBH0774809.1 hypothetical protein [Nocardia bovistercoris]